MTRNFAPSVVQRTVVISKRGNANHAEALYRAGIAPWDIGGAQQFIRRLVALGAVKGNVLGPGCGTGWHAIEYACAGCSVTAVDSSPTAIGRAQGNAQMNGAAIDFVCGDIRIELARYRQTFDTVVDCKLYDNLDGIEARRHYARGLHDAMKPGAKLLLYGFGAGHVNGFHNHELDAPDYDIVLPAAGFTIVYSGSAVYELNVGSWRPICPRCPSRLSDDGRLTIPLAEVHAVRNDA